MCKTSTWHMHQTIQSTWRWPELQRTQQVRVWSLFRFFLEGAPPQAASRDTGTPAAVNAPLLSRKRWLPARTSVAHNVIARDASCPCFTPLSLNLHLILHDPFHVVPEFMSGTTNKMLCYFQREQCCSTAGSSGAAGRGCAAAQGSNARPQRQTAEQELDQEGVRGPQSNPPDGLGARRERAPALARLIRRALHLAILGLLRE